MDNATRVGLNRDERYPTYLMGDDDAEAFVEVSAETAARWSAAEDAFNAAQDEMAALFDEAFKRARRDQAIAAAEKKVAEAQAALDKAREVPA